MHVAVRKGNERMVKLLLMSGANPSIKATGDPYSTGLDVSPLYIEGNKYAGPAGSSKSMLGNYNHKIFMLLLKAGADTSLTTVIGTTALHICANRGNLSCVKALLDSGAKITASDIKEAQGEEVIRLLKDSDSMN